MARQNRSCFTSVILSLLALLLLVAIVFAGYLLTIPGRAEQVFGPPSPRLGLLQRLWHSTLLLLQSDDLTKPVDPVGKPLPFKVEFGETAPSLIGRLWKDGLISNPGAFRTYLAYSGLDTSLQAGRYSLSPAMTPIEIARTLQDATPTHVTLVIIPGWRLEEIAAALPTSGLSVKPEVFMASVRTPPPGYSFSEDLPSETTLEGFMFPGSYELERNLSASGLITVLLDNFEGQISPQIRQGWERQGLNVFEGVTLASIIQREAVIEDDMPFIASVFINRLAIGMKLDSDPTIQYALGYDAERATWWTNPLSLADLRVESPYNTYANPGLPPGPIANPGLAALRSVAFPAQTPYYYFRAGCDGSGRHLFAETFQEHLANACP